MDHYKERIIKYIEDIERSVDVLIQDKADKNIEITRLTEENTQLKEVVRDMMSDIDKYILELEEIRKQYVSSNSSN